MILNRATVKAVRADLAGGEVALTFSIPLSDEILNVRRKLRDWREDGDDLRLIITPTIEQLSLIDVAPVRQPHEPEVVLSHNGRSIEFETGADFDRACEQAGEAA